MGRRLEALPPPIHNDISLVLFVIPGLTPYPVRGRLRNLPSFWIPALHHTRYRARFRGNDVPCSYSCGHV
jgi:hypothetical protein